MGSYIQKLLLGNVSFKFYNHTEDLSRCHMRINIWRKWNVQKLYVHLQNDVYVPGKKYKLYVKSCITVLASITSQIFCTTVYGDCHAGEHNHKHHYCSIFYLHE